MSSPPKPPNQFNSNKPITLRYSPWTPVSNSSLMLPSVTNTNLICPEHVYLTPMRTKNPQNGFERKMNIPTPRDALLTSCSSPALKPSLGTLPSAYNAIKHPAGQHFSTSTTRKGHYTQDASSNSYTPTPPHYFPPANYFPSELSQPAKATVSFQQNDSLNDYGTKERPQSPDVNGPPIDDLLGIKDLYPSMSESMLERFLREVQLDYNTPPDNQQVSQKEPEGKQKRGRHQFSKRQLEILEATFEQSKYPDEAQWSQLAQQFQVTRTQIKTWFQNRRTKEKRSERIRKHQLQQQSLAPYPSPYHPTSSASHSFAHPPSTSYSSTQYPLPPAPSTDFSALFGQPPQPLNTLSDPSQFVDTSTTLAWLNDFFQSNGM
ncbi:unnamed protein product [Caenorhabditis brenneri]